MRRVGVRDQFGESGTLEEIKECYGLTPPFIKEAVLGVAIPNTFVPTSWSQEAASSPL